MPVPARSVPSCRGSWCQQKNAGCRPGEDNPIRHGPARKSHAHRCRKFRMQVRFCVVLSITIGPNSIDPRANKISGKVLEQGLCGNSRCWSTQNRIVRRCSRVDIIDLLTVMIDDHSSAKLVARIAVTESTKVENLREDVSKTTKAQETEVIVPRYT